MSAEAKSPKTPAAKPNGASPGNGTSNSVSVSAQTSEPATVVAIKGSLDRGLDHVDKVLASKVDLVLDFSECTFVTVDGLEWLEELLLRAESLQSNVRLVKMHPTVYKVFKVAHIRSLLKACDSPAPRGPVC